MENPRRTRFIAYFESQLGKSREKLMLKTRLTKGRVSQLFDENQPFGEKAARSLAQRLGLDADYFEHDGPIKPASLSREALQWAARIEQMTPAERAKLDKLYEVLQEDATSVINDQPPGHGDLMGGDSQVGELDGIKANQSK